METLEKIKRFLEDVGDMPLEQSEGFILTTRHVDRLVRAVEYLSHGMPNETKRGVQSILEGKDID